MKLVGMVFCHCLFFSNISGWLVIRPNVDYDSQKWTFLLNVDSYAGVMSLKNIEMTYDLSPEYL